MLHRRKVRRGGGRKEKDDSTESTEIREADREDTTQKGGFGAAAPFELFVILLCRLPDSQCEGGEKIAEAREIARKK